MEWAQDLGYAVRLLKPTSSMPLGEVWGVLQESDVMLGVHGAGLTQILFLRPSTVFIQVSFRDSVILGCGVCVVLFVLVCVVG